MDLDQEIRLLLASASLSVKWGAHPAAPPKGPQRQKKGHRLLSGLTIGSTFCWLRVESKTRGTEASLAQLSTSGFQVSSGIGEPARLGFSILPHSYSPAQKWPDFRDPAWAGPLAHQPLCTPSVPSITGHSASPLAHQRDPGR
jgi:hypothetical protein